MLAHLGWTRGTIQADAVNSERADRSQRCSDFATEQHCAVGFNGHRNQNRYLTTQLFHCSLGADDCAFSLKQILNCLDQNGIDSAVD